MKEVKLENCCMGASTPGAVHSTEVVVEQMVEMTGWLAGSDTKMQRTKEGVYTRKDEQGVPKKVWLWFDLGCNMHGMTLACSTSMA